VLDKGKVKIEKVRRAKAAQCALNIRMMGNTGKQDRHRQYDK